MEKLIQWNLQSLNTNFSDLKLLLNQYNPACACLQETMIANRTITPPSNYNIMLSTPTRNDGHERGTAILIRKNIFSQQIALNTDLQAVAAKVYIGAKTYTICSLYLPHIATDKRDIKNLMNQLPQPFLILGDMNALSSLWSNDPNIVTNSRGQIFQELLLEENISLLNDNNPTHYHIQTNTLSVIDLSICSSDCLLDFDYSVCPYLHGSDHYPVCINLKNVPIVTNKPERFNTRKADWSSFSDLTKTDANGDNFPSTAELVDFIVEVLINAANQSIPKTSTKIKKPPVPWYNNEIATAQQARNRAERALRHQYSIENKISYNRAKARCRYQIKKAKQESWRNYLSSINQFTPLSSIWKKVQKISGKFSPTPPPILKTPNNVIIQDVGDVANMLAESFSRTCSLNNCAPEFQRYKREKEKKRLDFTSGVRHEYNVPLTIEELKTALKCTSETAPGPDKITYSMIKSSHKSLQQLLLGTYNRIYRTGEFPPQWGLSIVIPIAKPGKDQFNPTNYRPISLSSCICKLMEKMINNRLSWYLERNNVINPTQSGFRHNRSTTDNLVSLDSAIQKSMADKQHFIAVFFDIQKAYDTVWRYGVLQQLHDFGLRGNLPLFIKGFLYNRRLCVQIGNTISAEKSLDEGMPQGSVLSCTCFAIAINRLCTVIPANVEHSLYVDDFTIYTSGRLQQTVERRLQTAISKIETWTKQSGFIFSPTKTVSLHICRKHRCPKMAPNLTLNNNPIQNKEQHKYLGLIIDNSYTWRKHITQLKNKCTKTLDLLKHISSKSWGADRASLLNLYIMLIKPKIDYGIEIYSSAAKTYMKSVAAIQHSAIRIATGAFRSSPITSMHAESGLKPLDYYIETKILNYYLRTCVNPSHPLYNTITGNNEYPAKSFLHRAQFLAYKYDISTRHLLLEGPSEHHPWLYLPIHICTELYHTRKYDTPHLELRR